MSWVNNLSTSTCIDARGHCPVNEHEFYFKSRLALAQITSLKYVIAAAYYINCTPNWTNQRSVLLGFVSISTRSMNIL